MTNAVPSVFASYRLGNRKGDETMDKRPESALFQAALAAMVEYVGKTDDPERTLEVDGAFVMRVMQARAELTRAEGPAAGKRLAQELATYLRMKKEDTQQMERALNLLADILDERADMTIGEAIKIFHERGGREQ
jgi:hypothetical protein